MTECVCSICMEQKLIEQVKTCKDCDMLVCTSCMQDGICVDCCDMAILCRSTPEMRIKEIQESKKGE